MSTAMMMGAVMGAAGGAAGLAAALPGKRQEGICGSPGQQCVIGIQKSGEHQAMEQEAEREEPGVQGIRKRTGSFKVRAGKGDRRE